jgi:Ca2+-binding EF-hand superfamily protein
MDAIQALASSASSSTQSTGFAQPFAISSPASTAGNTGSVTTGFGAPSQISPATMQALLAAQSQSSTTNTSTPTSRSAALQNLFSQIDANGDGQITKSEFENALGAGGTNTAQADSVFNQLDTNSDGSVSLSELSAALKGKGGGHHGHHAASAGGSDSTDPSTDPLLQALQGSSSTSTSPSGGLSVASLTPIDKSSLTAISLGSNNAAWSYHSLDQMMQRQTQAMSFNA